ncbi:putative 5'-nucleotidase [Vibrio nigripulchritudo SFn27]|nr:putative 5'-nucleotidase [Vibrio nigripulchritudo BLFn1]CCN91652.1 putative 5'-nucleotidase [Vibrio nigripulchritudo SFn27]CCN96536.1 putative 5'-nucleotidase [Vibrio nigripulchritudo ENn2]CCO38410.1 putative 5'-nucleotidase [Vibrio nigripulchritudo SFn135]CCO53867.1 putative 5'-nucleotidase [Vibrio nigripulchritudo Wn13]
MAKRQKEKRMKKQNKKATLTIAHINDTHSYFEPSTIQLHLNIGGRQMSPFISVGGFARISNRLHQIRKNAESQNRRFLFFHAGDCFQGTLYFSLFKGRANAEMLSALNPDAMVVGNHELDMGNEPVADFLDHISFPMIASNWDLSSELDKPNRLSDKANLHTYKKEKSHGSWLTFDADGEEIAVFSLSLDKMADISNPDADTPFLNAKETAEQTIKAIQSSGINKIILLSHLGYEEDKQLAEEIDGVSLIIGGHTHVIQGDFTDIGLTKHDDYGLLINGTRVVQAGCYAQFMGHCEIDFDEAGNVTRFEGKNELLVGRRLAMDASLDELVDDSVYDRTQSVIYSHPNVIRCTKDQAIKAILDDKYRPQVNEIRARVIGEASKTYRHVRIPDEEGPSELAPIVCRSFVEVMNNDGHNVEFAVHNAGGVRNSLPEGKITVDEVAGKLLPFAIPVGYYNIKGKYVRQMLEGAINNALSNGVVGTGSGSYPYTYNLRFEYDADAELGNRMSTLEIRRGELWEEVEDDKIYRGCSTAYTMKGKEGYDAVLKMEDKGYVSNHSMADCMITLIQENPEIFI